MSAWAHIENIAWCVAFVAILILLDGWGKAWAILPLLLINYPRRNKAPEQNP